MFKPSPPEKVNAHLDGEGGVQPEKVHDITCNSIKNILEMLNQYDPIFKMTSETSIFLPGMKNIIKKTFRISNE